MTSIEFRVEHDGPGAAGLRCLVDGADVLAGFEHHQLVDPDELIPPLSDALLPTRGGRTAVIGVCACGVAGCGNVSVRISREGAIVIWEPVENPDYETLGETYRFDLVRYLDAVDAAAEHPGDGQTRRVVRRLRLAAGFRAQTGQDGFRYFNRAGELTHVQALGDGRLTARVRLGPGPRREDAARHDFTPLPDESDGDFAWRVMLELMQRYIGAGPEDDG